MFGCGGARVRRTGRAARMAFQPQRTDGHEARRQARGSGSRVSRSGDAASNERETPSMGRREREEHERQGMAVMITDAV